MKTIRAKVTGRVQGVYYRQSTQEQAQALQLVGWVRNLADGRVDVLAQGEAAQVDALVQWLHQGPEMAEVDLVEVESQNFQELNEFVIRQ